MKRQIQDPKGQNKGTKNLLNINFNRFLFNQTRKIHYEKK